MAESSSPPLHSRSRSSVFRPVCKYGTSCYRRNPDHIHEEAHPADHDYLDCCRHASVEPVFVSIHKLFEWCDVDRSGRVGQEELRKVWPVLQQLGQDVADLDDALFGQLDEDGNGFVNFSEFAEYTTARKVGLPLGLDDLLGMTNQASMKGLRCGVYDCSCRDFAARRRQCKYGAECYQKSEEHRQTFAHPSDEDYEACGSQRGGREMCRCGHKKQLHASALTGAASVEYPKYWQSHDQGGDEAVAEFNDLVAVPDDVFAQLQQLLDATYSDVTTRDRNRHSGSWMVPRDFKLVTARRNENSKLWRKYTVAKAKMKKEREDLAPDEEYKIYDDVLTTRTWESFDADALEQDINEWYLFHGTSASAATNICSSDFKMRLAGSATGTLYGRGSYLAESITKADEYAREEDGMFTVLLCRVLGGRVCYCDERTPDPEQLTKNCTEGDYDCVLGDRKKVAGTYREFIIFDNENVYPEYVLQYTRGELFKSASYPSHA